MALKVIAHMKIKSTLDDTSNFAIFEGSWQDGRPEAVFIAPVAALEDIERGNTRRQTYFADNALEAMDVLAREMAESVTITFPMV